MFVDHHGWVYGKFGCTRTLFGYYNICFCNVTRMLFLNDVQPLAPFHNMQNALAYSQRKGKKRDKDYQ